MARTRQAIRQLPENMAPIQMVADYYSTGTASRSGTAITGVGTTWTAAMTGMIFVFADQTSCIVTFVDATHLTSNISGTVSSQSYNIKKPALGMDSSGRIFFGSATVPNESKAYFFGGINGANVDARASSGLGEADQAIFDAQGSDYATTAKSTYMFYGGPGAIGTTLGITNVKLSALIMNGDTALIGSVNDIPLIFGLNNVEKMRLSSGKLGLGTGSTISAKLHVIETTEQLRLGYDTSNYYKTTVNSTGGVTFDAVGSGAGFTFSDPISASNFDTDGTLSANSDSVIATQKAVKTYVDAIASGLSAKAAVRAATTANITLSGAQTIDGVSIIAGDRVLVMNQSTGSQNGIYVCASGSWTRSTDADTSAEVPSGMFVFVSEGTTYADTGWVLATNAPITLGTTSLSFVQFSAAGSIIDGLGLLKTGNTFDVQVDGSTLEISSDALRIKDAGVTLAKMANMATASLLGRNTAGTGVPEVLSASTVRSLLGLVIGTNVQAWDTDLDTLAGLAPTTDNFIQSKSGAWASRTVAQVKTDLGLTGTNSGDQTITLTGNVTGSGTGSFATTIASGVVTLAMMANMATASLIYRRTAGSGAPEVNTLAQLKTDLVLTASDVGLSNVTNVAQLPLSYLDTDVSLAANSDSKVPSQKAIKSYVDAVAQGLTIKPAVRAATTANITLSGAQTIDGVSVIAGDRVLVKAQSTGANNGIYVCASGSWTRAVDMDTSAESLSGLFVFVSEGTVNADSGWVLTTNDPITLGTTALSFTQFSGAGQIVDGAALLKTGNTLDVQVDGSTIEISSDALRIKDAGVTLAKMANMATASLIGRNTAGTGVPEVLSASTVRSLLGLVIGTNVQAWDADLDTWATKTAPSGTVVGTSDSQTLTTKTINLSNNTLSGTIAQFNTACSDADFLSMLSAKLTSDFTTSPTYTTPQDTGLSVTLAASTWYRLEGWFLLDTSFNKDYAQVQWAGTATFSSHLNHMFSPQFDSTTSLTYFSPEDRITDLPYIPNGYDNVNNTFRLIHFVGTIQTNGAGTLKLQIFNNSFASSVTMKKGSFLSAIPI